MLETLPRRSERHARRRGAIILISLLVVMALIVGALLAFYSWSTGASGPRTKIVLVIPRGATGAEVAELLEDKGVIRSALGFKLFSRFRGESSGFDAGRYTNLTTNMTVGAALAALEAGPVVESVSAGFPEGLTVEQMAQRAAQELGVSKSAFLDAATGEDVSLPPYLAPKADTLEGFLFPSTYEFKKGVDAKGVVDRLVEEFKDQAESLDLVEGADALGMTPYEIVIIASMIEREARFDEDRPKIAAVIYNRLEDGMLLQIDATVEYALDKYKSALTYDDLKVESPYNTYLHPGLPPTPIASPGRASLQAALHPADVDYLYYLVIDDEGHHYFTASYQDFLNHKNQVSG